jgi:hypothetical protein
MSVADNKPRRQHMTFDTITLSLPAHWLPAIVNDDPSGLDDKEHRALRRWMRDTVRDCGAFHIGTISDGEHFARYHDAAEYGVLACMCHDVDLCFLPAEAA